MIRVIGTMKNGACVVRNASNQEEAEHIASEMRQLQINGKKAYKLVEIIG